MSRHYIDGCAFYQIVLILDLFRNGNHIVFENRKWTKTSLYIRTRLCCSSLWQLNWRTGCMEWSQIQPRSSFYCSCPIWSLEQSIRNCRATWRYTWGTWWFYVLDIKTFSDFDYEDPGQVELYGTGHSTAGFKRLLWWNMYSCHSGIQWHTTWCSQGRFRYYFTAGTRLFISEIINRIPIFLFSVYANKAHPIWNR